MSGKRLLVVQDERKVLKGGDMLQIAKDSMGPFLLFFAGDLHFGMWPNVFRVLSRASPYVHANAVWHRQTTHCDSCQVHFQGLHPPGRVFRLYSVYAFH